MPERQTIDAELRSRVEEFTAQALANIPEIDGLIVIPAWTVAHDSLPRAYIQPRQQLGRMGQPLSPGLLMRLAINAHHVLTQLNNQQLNMLEAIDAAFVQRAAQAEAATTGDVA